MQNNKEECFQVMQELNQRMTIKTAYSLWLEKHHLRLLQTSEEYSNMFRDTSKLIIEWANPELPLDTEAEQLTDNIAKRIFFILSTTYTDTVPFVTVVSTLEATCQKIGANYSHNMELYSDLLYHLRHAQIFTYEVTRNNIPIIFPRLKINASLAKELKDKFAAALPQIGGVTGILNEKGYGLLPGIHFEGKSSRRTTPLNEKDREILSIISQQEFKVAMDIVESMEYYVPTMTKNGFPISPQQQEYTRTAYYRFVDMARIAQEYETTIQLPTTVDSRGRFYNMATDPSVRLSLRSKYTEGNLTEFELNHLTNT